MIRLRPSGVDEILIKRVQDWYEPGPGVFIQSLTASFSPAQLFTGTTTGAWYDPSDLNTLFQDAAGTTPVTAVEQPVGLMLDKRDTTYSTYFDGSGDYLSTPNSSSLLFDAGDFTIEAWVNPSTTNHTSAGIFASAFTTGNVQLAVALASSSSRDVVGNYVRVEIYNGSFTTSVSTNSLPINTWSHVAVSRSGTNIRTFINGALEATLVFSGSLPTTSNEFLVGRRWDLYGSYPYLNGNISNLRIVKGAALYTANFTPPTSPLTAVAGTSLLTCGTTWSGNPAITNNGNTRADKLNPFTTGTGNHAFNSSGNSANFPVLSARYNLLTKTEQFDNAVWGKSTVIAPNITADQAASPLGDVTADKVAMPAVSGSGAFCVLYASPTQALSTAHSFSVYLRGEVGGEVIWLSSFGATYTSTQCTLTTSWQKFTLNFTTSASGVQYVQFGVDLRDASQSAKGAQTFYAWGADLRVTNDALNQPAYQRVNTATDYDTVGFKPYLRFNGTNQWLQTNSIDFTYGDKMFVSAGVRKLSDAASAAVVELSATTETNAGAFYILAPGGAGANSYRFGSRGSTAPTAATDSAQTGQSYLAPETAVISGIGSISTDVQRLRRNGTQVAENIVFDQGIGTYHNYPLYIGARAGTSLWFNGRLYQLVVAGKQASAAEITNTETFINQKTGAY